MNRRGFIRRAAAGFLVTPAMSLLGRQSPPRGFRTITYNILACKGYQKRVENRERLQRARPQIPERIALELALYEPDLVTFQESPSEAVVTRIARSMGMHYAYFPGGFPGTLLSRLPIVSATNCPLKQRARPADLFTRHWGRAVIPVGDDELIVYTAHLIPGDAEGIQTREVAAMLEAMADDLESGRSMLMQGDLNHGPDSPFYAQWVDAGLIDAFASRGAGDGKTFSSTDRRWRIDYVWAKGPIADRLVSSRVLYQGAFRDNPDDATSFALSDHLPVIATFGAP